MYGYNTCPRCGSVLDHQSDFDDELEEYTCSACQCLLHRDSVYDDFEISEYDTASAIGAGIGLIFGAGALFGALSNKKTSKEEEELLEKEKGFLSSRNKSTNSSNKSISNSNKSTSNNSKSTSNSSLISKEQK